MPTTGPNTKAGEKPPIMPLEATQHTPDGAKAFAQFFIKTIDWGYATTSSSYMRHYFQGCESCKSFADFIGAAQKAGHRFIGGRLTVTTVTLAQQPTTPNADYTAIVTFNDTSFEEVTKNNKFVRADGAHRGEKFEVSVTWTSIHWVVVKLEADQ